MNITLRNNGQLVDAEVKQTISLADTENFNSTFQNFFAGINGNAESSSWVWDCIDIWGKHFGKTEFNLYEEATDTKIEKHPLLQIFRKPNLYQYWFEIKYSIAAHWSLYGKAYLWKVRDGFGIVRELILLPPSSVQVVAIQTPLDYFNVTTMSGIIQVQPIDMVYIRYPDPQGFNQGKAIISNVIDPATVDSLRTKYEKMFFEKGGFMGLIFSTPVNMGQPSFDRAKTELRSNYGGLRNSYDVSLFDNDLKPIQATHSIKDMDISPLKDASMNEILAAWGVSKFQLGMGEGINRATAIEVSRRFAGDVIEPLLCYLDDVLTYQLCKVERGWDYLEIEHEETSPRDIEGDALWYKSMTEVGAITPNQIREKEGEEIMDIEGMDVPLALQGKLQISNGAGNGTN